MARPRAARRPAYGTIVFAIGFALYTLVAVALLALGLAPALVASPPSLEATAGGGPFGVFAPLIARAMPYVEPAPVIALDYALSLLNLSVGVFLVLRRPDEWVPRLLGIGMVGTAFAFNIQSHGVIVAEIQPIPGAAPIATGGALNVLHIGYHAVSGAAYAHAFLLLPNSALMPRWLRWPVLALYLILLEEIVIPAAGYGVVGTSRPGLVMGLFDDAFAARGFYDGSLRLTAIVDAEIVFFVLFFGVLIPLSGLYALFSRYRILDATERAQTRVIVFTLVFAFAVGLAFIAVSSVVVGSREGAGAAAASNDLRKLVFRIFPPLYAVIPPALFAAILRYRLYDIDILVNRTLVYGSATAILAVGFAALSAIAQRAFESLTGARSDVVSIMVGLGLLLGFAPLRRWIQPLVDRLLPARGVLTLLFTDIVSSTTRAVELGDERWRRVLATYRATVRHELARFGGREIDTAGDGFFVTFERPVPALHCAVALQQALRDIGLDSRFGLHAGECQLRGEGVSGVNVIVAARVMALATANEIVVSRAVCELAAGSDLRFQERGIHALKGVPGQWDLHLVSAQPQG
jgi:class 3 adenylate cyclase